VPTYNEAENVGELLERISRAMAGKGFSYEVVIVDDSSSDGTAEVARDAASRHGISLKLVIRSSRGLAGAVVRGFREGFRRVYIGYGCRSAAPPRGSC